MANVIKQRLRKHTLGTVWMVIKNSKNMQLGLLMPEMWGHHMDLVCAPLLLLLLERYNLGPLQEEHTRQHCCICILQGSRS